MEKEKSDGSIRVISAEFVASSDRLDTLPVSEHFEFAVIGRSNVGKSTFINRILGRRKLARTSNTPGRTKTAVLFEAVLRRDGVGDEAFSILDLPGFGFAKVSKTERESFWRLLVNIVERREMLSLVCILNDIRRDPKEEELEIHHRAATAGASTIIVLTKADQLKRGEIAAARARIANAYGLDPSDLILTGEGVEPAEFWNRVLMLREALE